jgi:hypothetical protein
MSDVPDEASKSEDDDVDGRRRAIGSTLHLIAPYVAASLVYLVTQSMSSEWARWTLAAATAAITTLVSYPTIEVFRERVVAYLDDEPTTGRGGLWDRSFVLADWVGKNMLREFRWGTFIRWWMFTFAAGALQLMSAAGFACVGVLSDSEHKNCRLAANDTFADLAGKWSFFLFFVFSLMLAWRAMGLNSLLVASFRNRQTRLRRLSLVTTLSTTVLFVLLSVGEAWVASVGEPSANGRAIDFLQMEMLLCALFFGIHSAIFGAGRRQAWL